MCFPVEEGTRGFICQSTWRMLGAVGVKGRRRREVTKRVTEEAERASRWLWVKNTDGDTAAPPSCVGPAIGGETHEDRRKQLMKPRSSNSHCVRFDNVLNCLPHSSHRYGLSPVWVRMCVLRCPS
ncbi:hypothetical protein Bbelb_276200 [Branchiostoma belcheri]|nr:hypothetical protein Bbelb_276200 [Branchiostoma belcheri]